MTDMNEVWQMMKAYADAYAVPILRDAELPLFRGLIQSARPKRVLEIGTAIGYSTLQMASCLDADSQITTIELDPDRVAAARRFIGMTPFRSMIRQLQGDGTALLDTLSGPWDFVFLDGPKGQYSRQLKKLLTQLAPQAVIAADNIRYHDMLYIEGTVPHKHRTAVGRLHEFLTLLGDTRRFDTVFFENGDGMTVSRWKG